MVHFDLHLSLPRESRYVPVLRTIAAEFLVHLGVEAEDVSDVELALTEACANVVRHATGTDEYRVEVTVAEDGCSISVVDDGPGFDPDGVRLADAREEHGRGLALMDAVVDRVTFTRDPEGHRVHLEKRWEAPTAGQPG